MKIRVAFPAYCAAATLAMFTLSSRESRAHNAATYDCESPQVWRHMHPSLGGLSIRVVQRSIYATCTANDITDYTQDAIQLSGGLVPTLTYDPDNSTISSDDVPWCIIQVRCHVGGDPSNDYWITDRQQGGHSVYAEPSRRQHLQRARLGTVRGLGGSC